MHLIVEPSADEVQNRRLKQQTLEQILKLYSEQGFVTISGILSKETVRLALQEFASQLDVFSGKELPIVGPGRFMLPVNLKNGLNVPWIYANPIVIQIIRELLGDHILNSFGAVVATSGAKAQRAHYDHPEIFEGADHTLPPYAITVGIPLINFTEQSGTTKAWPGSHLQARNLEQSPEQSVSIPGPSGSIYLFDYRLLHAGTENTSPWIRPLLYLVYSKPWFRDSVNFQYWKGLDISDEEWEKVPPILRRLFRGIKNLPMKSRSIE
jgi:hypothetical protein